MLLCQFLVLGGNRFWFYILMYLEYNTVVRLCQFFGCGGKYFSNENKFLQKNLIGLLYYDLIADVCIS